MARSRMGRSDDDPTTMKSPEVKSADKLEKAAAASVPKPTGIRILIKATCALGSGTRKPGDTIGIAYMEPDSSYAELVNALNNPQLIQLESI